MSINSRYIKIEYYRSSGPGGQHKNKKFTAVKIMHLPTGITAVAAEQRSQAQNREMALERLQAKVAKLTRKKKERKPTALPRSVKERILEIKKKRSQIKKLRRQVNEYEE
ncbi:MAG: peptide chain release factor-like protein [Candidatus Omnitrophica bacterium]|nr:peptide chain release factor-like protein [Candidatus Omnitrophota bacterium]MDD5351960.1 peptide chain release factor-like protein [Candidatus Omnitrophota bacterium]MDD5550786.1 peptide chain release factor-like protein [Candidatus Omnitrophota bacterium]